MLALHHLLERQHYRLAHWELASSEINYRRFFDINSLAGLRIEDEATFEAIHRLVARLIAQGMLARVCDSTISMASMTRHQYFRTAAAPDRRSPPAVSDPFYVVVEKILADGERLPHFIGVAGTTGYEWLNMISRVLIDDRGLVHVDRIWREMSGDHRSFGDVLIEAKRCVIAGILASEFTVLTRLLARIAAGHYRTRDYASERLRAALELFVLHFPVYRTYLTASGTSRKIGPSLSNHRQGARQLVRRRHRHLRFPARRADARPDRRRAEGSQHRAGAPLRVQGRSNSPGR